MRLPILELLVLVATALPAFAEPPSDLTKYECSSEWAGWFGYGNDKSVFTCSNGRKFHKMSARCTYLEKGLIFNSMEETNVDLLCDVNGSSVQECLADNIKHASEIEKCQTEADAERADFISRSHSPN